jgi:hypothetical protein
VKHPVATQFLAKAQRKLKGAKSNVNNSGESNIETAHFEFLNPHVTSLKRGANEIAMD